MRLHITFTFLIVSMCGLIYGQDQMVVPFSNPSLLPQSMKSNANLKLNVREDSVIYLYDTLSLPFVDDFSLDHFQHRLGVGDVQASRDTTVFKVYVSNMVYDETSGLVTDSTFIFQIGNGDTIVQRTPNIIGQLTEHKIDRFPTTSVQKDYFAPYNIYDTLSGGSDTIAVQADLFQDSANYYFVEADSSIFYIDRAVYLNSSFPINPPTIGVVTFDGLDQFGFPYDQESDRRVAADQLTSVPIDLTNLADTNVYFSFYYQPKGLALDGPESQDSLALDFYNASTSKWVNVWSTPGYEADTFRQSIIKVNNILFSNAFQFRFRAYANSTGAFDQWHLDYLYLDADRSLGDTIRKDISYVNPAPSFLTDYYRMPWWHFKSNPANYLANDLTVLIKNNFSGGININNNFSIPDTINGGNHYSFSGLAITQPYESLPRTYNNPFDYSTNQVDTAGVFSARYDIYFTPGVGEKNDFIRTNDTIYSRAVLQNDYAYDDGTAEAGYGVNPQNSSSGLKASMAVEFDIPFQDTIGGVRIYFLPQRNDIRNQNFELKVWNASSSGGPGQEVFTKQMKDNPLYTDDNGLITYWFDSLIVVGQRFYVGLEATGQYSLNVGYDLNTNNRDKIFWSYNGNSWSNPSRGIFDGSLMIRPVFRKKSWDVSLPKQRIEERVINIYPNPVDYELQISDQAGSIFENVQLFNLQGNLVLEKQNVNKVDVNFLPEGIYFLIARDRQGVSYRKKLLISH